MDEPRAVHGGDRGGEGPRHGEHVGAGGAPAACTQLLDAAAQGAAVGELEHQIGLLVVVLVDVVDGDEVTPADPAQAAALGDEPLADLRVQAVVLREHLHRDVRVEPLVAGAVHGREGARADHPAQAVALAERRHAGAPGTGSPAPSRPASIARPRLTCDFTVPSARSSCAAICA